MIHRTVARTLANFNRSTIKNGRYFSSSSQTQDEKSEKVDDDTFDDDYVEEDEKKFTVWRALRWCLYGVIGYNYYLFWNSEDPKEQIGYQDHIYRMNLWIHSKFKIGHQYLMEPPVEKF